MSEHEWYVTLGRRLRDARLARGWTLYDVAAVTESTASAVSSWERGIRRMKAWQYVVLRDEGLLA